MMEQFDDIFRENVKKAFSSYNADHLADEGWDSFSARKKVPQRRTVLIPLWARAASVLLLVGLGIFIADRIYTLHMAREIIPVAESTVTKDEATDTPDRTSKEISRTSASEGKTQGRELNINHRKEEVKLTYKVRDSMLDLLPPDDKNIVSPEIAERCMWIPDHLPFIPAAGALKDLRKRTVPDGTLSADLLYEDHKSAEETPAQQKYKSSRTLIAGFSGSFAHSSGIASPASGLSLGLYLDQKLSKKISLRPGLALALQSFGLGNGNNNSGFNNSLELYGGISGSPYSYKGHLNMLAMELPLNIVFRIIEKEHAGLYIAAGASTMIFLSQQFSADYVNTYTQQSFNSMSGDYFSETRYSTIEIEKNYGTFSRTDFMGLANLSAGYSFPYSNRGILLIEPFIQLPVRDITSLNLKVRYGGLSLKLQLGKQEQGK